MPQTSGRDIFEMIYWLESEWGCVVLQVLADDVVHGAAGEGQQGQLSNQRAKRLRSSVSKVLSIA